MPDLPYPIGTKYGKPNNRDIGGLENAKGFATGASFEFEASNSFGLSIFEAYGNIRGIIGFDMMMQKVAPGYVCPNTGTTPGFKGWFLRGQIYTYLSGNVGIRGTFKKLYSFDFSVFEASAITVLYGELVKPAYISGFVECEYSAFKGAFHGSFNFDFEKGQRCG